jgi:hypothetical protein
VLPVVESDECKGFQRKLREFDLWKNLFYATALALFAALFDFTDVEIYWQLLVFYFITVTLFLCRFKLEHMVRYQYNPFTCCGKKKPKHERIVLAESHF